MAKKKRKPRAKRKQVIPSQPDAIPYSKYRIEWMDILSDSGWATDKEFHRMKLAFPVNEGDEVILSTDKGKVIRCAVREIRIAGRNTQGVRIIKLSGEEKVVSAIKIDDNFI